MAFKSFISVAKITIFCILAWIFILVLIPILVPLLCILIPYKWLVNLILSWRHPGSVPLTGMDIASATTWEMYKSEGKLLSNLGNALIVIGDVDITELRKRVQEKLLDVKLPVMESTRNRKYRFDRLRRYPFKFMWHWYWSAEMEDVDVASVVKERRTKTTDLEEFINDWLHIGFQDHCPMWEIIVYKDEDEYQGRSVIAIKMAHGLGDGYSIRTICGALMDTESPMLTREALLLYDHSWVHPLELLIFITMGPYLLLSFLKTALFHRDALWEMNKSAESVIGFMSVTLESVKRIRRHFDCKFNDVCYVVFGNAVRRHLQESVPKSRLPETLPFFCAREVPNRPLEICNHFTQQLFQVPVTSGDRSQNLLRMKRETIKVFQYSLYKLNYYLSGITELVPSIFFPTSDTARPGVCCALAPIPDVKNSEYFGPYPVQHGFGLAGLQTKNLAFFGTTVTLGEYVNITLLGNKGVFKTREEMNRLKFFVQEEFRILLETLKLEVQNETRVNLHV